MSSMPVVAIASHRERGGKTAGSILRSGSHPLGLKAMWLVVALARGCFGAILLATSLVQVEAAAREPNDRRVAHINVSGGDPGGANRSTRSLASVISPNGKSVLIVLDAHLTSSRELTDTLTRLGYLGKQAVVIVIGDSPSAEAFLHRAELLPEAKWVSGKSSMVMQGLKLAGTPVVLGVDGEQQIAWEESGVPQQPEHLALRIVDWIQPAGVRLRSIGTAK